MVLYDNIVSTEDILLYMYATDKSWHMQARSEAYAESAVH